MAVKKGKEYWDQAIKKFIKSKKNH
jgi:hypothetical protein